MAQYIPKEFIQDLLHRVDIVDVISKRISLKKNGHDYFCCCPFHQEKTPSFSVIPKNQFYYCFGCGVSGNVISFLMEFEHCSFVEAVTSLAEEHGIKIPLTNHQGKHYAQNEGLHSILADVVNFYQKTLTLNSEAYAYLQNRGLSDDIIQSFHIGYAATGWDNLLKQLGHNAAAEKSLYTAGMLIQKEQGGYYDRFRHRIMFPICNRSGKYIAFGGRVLDDSQPKYLNSPETPIFQKSQELYGLHYLLSKERDYPEIMIVEGYMDVLALAQHGYSRSVATLGTAISQYNLEKLFRLTNKIIFCFDGDNAGKKAAWRALQNTIKIMQDGRQAYFLFLPDGDDPDSFIRRTGKDTLLEQIESAMSLTQFLFSHLRSQADPSTIEGRLRFAQLALPLIKTITSQVFQQIMIDELTKITRIERHALQQELFNRHEAAKMPTKKAITHRQRLNLTQTATAFLIQHPTLISVLPQTQWLLELATADAHLLFTIIELLHDNPNANTAYIIEHFRETSHDEATALLASYALLCPNDGLINEFSDIMQQLRYQLIDKQIHELMQKAQQSSLSSHEKKQLQTLLRERKTKA